MSHHCIAVTKGMASHYRPALINIRIHVAGVLEILEMDLVPIVAVITHARICVSDEGGAIFLPCRPGPCSIFLG